MKAEKKKNFPGLFLPYATNFSEDLDIFCAFYEALYAGVKLVAKEDLSAHDRGVWEHSLKYLELRK